MKFWMTSAAISKPITSIPLCLRKRSAPMQNITTAWSIYAFPPESQAPLMPLTSQSRISLRTIRISIWPSWIPNPLPSVLVWSYISCCFYRRPVQTKKSCCAPQIFMSTTSSMFLLSAHSVIWSRAAAFPNGKELQESCWIWSLFWSLTRTAASRY